MTKAINLQDSILNQVRKENISVIIHLVNGFQIKGFVKGFDNFTVIMDSMGKQQLVYKHAISTITRSRPVDNFEKKAENMDLSDEKYLRSILRYIVENYEEHEMLKVLGKATCLYGSYAVNTESSEKILYYKKAVELQRKLGRLEGMEDLLRGLLRQYELTGQAPEEDYGSMLQALTSIRKELGINDKSFMAQEISSECVLLHEVLRDYRQERNLSVRQIDEKACSEKTYRALEKGKRGANHSTYDLLAELMDIQIGRYNADIVSDKYSDYKLAAELIAERQSQNRAKSMEMLDELEKAYNKSLSKFALDEMIKSPDWELMFGDLDELTTTKLYIVRFLHQTTTHQRYSKRRQGCI